MLSTNIITKLIGLKDVIVTDVNEIKNTLCINVELEVREHKCPCCKEKTTKIHDRPKQIVKDAPAFGKHIVLILKKRRYKCKKCGKQFYEENHFLPRYYRMTNRLAWLIIEKLREERSFTSVARELNLSTNTVIRVFDLVSYPKPKLPTALSIDEFKGNAGSEKYQCIIADAQNGIVLDILPKRYSHYLIDYFKHTDRNDVQFFISDMWRPYSDLARNFFPKANRIIDKYHFIRQVVWAFEAVRKQEQKKFSKTHRQYFKRSKSLLIKRFEFLSDEEKQQVNIILYTSVALSTAYFLTSCENLKIGLRKSQFVDQLFIALGYFSCHI